MHLKLNNAWNILKIRDVSVSSLFYSVLWSNAFRGPPGVTQILNYARRRMRDFYSINKRSGSTVATQVASLPTAQPKNAMFYLWSPAPVSSQQRKICQEVKCPLVWISVWTWCCREFLLCLHVLMLSWICLIVYIAMCILIWFVPCFCPCLVVHWALISLSV